jgi:hypothetical protein
MESRDGLQRGMLPDANQRGGTAFQRFGDAQRACKHRVGLAIG